MEKRHFRQEEIEKLKQNQYVKSVNQDSIQYTDEFREKYGEEREKGKKPTEIFRAFGLNSELLGQQRIDSFDKRIRKKLEQKESLHDQRQSRSGRVAKDLTTMSEKEQINYLKSEIEYYRQTNEFLKKNIALREKYALKKK